MLCADGRIASLTLGWDLSLLTVSAGRGHGHPTDNRIIAFDLKNQKTGILASTG